MKVLRLLDVATKNNIFINTITYIHGRNLIKTNIFCQELKKVIPNSKSIGTYPIGRLKLS